MAFVIFFVVDAEDTSSGDPSFAFCGHEFSYSVLADKFEIFDFTHSVFCPVACIEVFEPLARELRTMAAEAARAFGADAQAAMRAGFWSVLVEANAAVAGIVLAQKCSANPAVHSAWGDEVWGDSISHFERDLHIFPSNSANSLDVSIRSREIAITIFRLFSLRTIAGFTEKKCPSAMDTKKICRLVSDCN